DQAINWKFTLNSTEAIITCVHGMATFYTHFWGTAWGKVFTEMANYIESRIDTFNDLRQVSHLERAILEPLAILSADITGHTPTQYSPTQYRELVDAGIRLTLGSWTWETEVYYNHINKGISPQITPTTSENIQQRLQSTAVKGLRADLCPMATKAKRSNVHDIAYNNTLLFSTNTRERAGSVTGAPNPCPNASKTYWLHRLELTRAHV
ncbi:hypothetical protein B484DRAFT_439692, partial [Ochromonadaceae sp. CCMP2298]